MAMTKKDYERVALILRTWRGHPEAVDGIALDLCEMFGEDNPRFDAERFLSATGDE